jgi:hypothetical protein
MKKIILFFIVLLFFYKNAAAQGGHKEAESKIFSIYVYSLTKYIEWPEQFSGGDFSIAVLGDSKILNQLKESGKLKTRDNRNIVITEYKNPGEFQYSHIIVVPEENSKLLQEILKHHKDKPSVIVTSQPGLLKLGSNVNFVYHDGKMKYELNPDAMRKTGLKVANELEALAVK